MSEVNKKRFYCVFCGRHNFHPEVTTIVNLEGGPSICDICVDEAHIKCAERRVKLALEKEDKCLKEDYERVMWSNKGP